MEKFLDEKRPNYDELSLIENQLGNIKPEN